MAEIALSFEVELLEDLHTGTGVGRLGLLDDTQSRDQNGRPVVWSSAVRGLLREAGQDCIEAQRRAGLPEGDPGRLTRLLGWRGDQPARAVVRSLRLSAPATQEFFTQWASASREVHGRRPDDTTLRFIEFARAGLHLRGEIRLPDDTTSEDVAFLRQCLQPLTALGGRKTRGWGQLRLLPVEERRLETPGEHRLACELAALPGDRPACLRLLLRNLEPLNLARTAFAGNLIFSQSFAPGSALRGALLHWLSRHGHADLAGRLAASMQVSNVYNLSGTEAPSGWDQYEVLPLPLSLMEPKDGQTPSAKERSPTLPWWARPEGGDDRLQRPAWDRLAEAVRADVGERPGDRRIKMEEYLVRGPGESHWRRLRPKMGVLLRNSVPTERLDPDSRRSPDDPGGQEDSLFSEQVLWEDQRFLADLHFDDRHAAGQFVEAAAALLEGDEVQRSWLRVGRKGRPILVEDVRWQNAPPDGRKGPTDHLTLTLTSDLIARTPWLSFHTELNLEALADLVRDAGEDVPLVDGLVCDSNGAICEPVEIYGFNRATGLPRSPAVAIKRGSVCRLRSDPDQPNAEANLQAWRRTLRGIAGRAVGIGERTADGFGRFILDLDVHEPDYWEQPVLPLGHDGEKPEHNWREAVLANLKRFLGDHRARLAALSASQWLRYRVQALRSAEELEQLFADLPGITDRLGARERWRPLLAPLGEAVRKAGLSLEARRFFLDMLVQGAVADLRRKREQEGSR